MLSCPRAVDTVVQSTSGRAVRMPGVCQIAALCLKSSTTPAPSSYLIKQESIHNQQSGPCVLMMLVSRPAVIRGRVLAPSNCIPHCIHWQLH
jgi:hypothetical protein